VQGFKANVRGWLGQNRLVALPGARSTGKPAATAILYVADKVGYCADAATDPAFGRGLQAALLGAVSPMPRDARRGLRLQRCGVPVPEPPQHS